MAIPPSPGKVTIKELEDQLEAAKTQMTSVQSQLDELKKHPDRIYEHKPAAGRGGKFPEAQPAVGPTNTAKSDFEKAAVKPSTISAAPAKK